MNTMQWILTVILSAVAAVSLVMVVIKRRRGRGANAAPTTPQAKASAATPVEPAADVRVASSEELFGPFTAPFAEQLPMPGGTAAEIQKELRQAGYYRPTAFREFNALRFVLIFSTILLTGVLALLLPSQSTKGVLIGGAIVTLLGFSLPRVIMAAQGRSRVQKILRGLPDAVDLINMGVSRGLTFAAALERVQSRIREVHPELSRELDIVQQQAKVGTLEKALKQFERRIDTPEIRSLTGTLIQTERLGTSLITALETYAASVRTGLKQAAERTASTAPFKLLFPIVLCLVPAVYMVLLGPAVLEIGKFLRNRNEVLSSPRARAARIGRAATGARVGELPATPAGTEVAPGQ